LKAEITKLSDLYYSLLQGNHHKDRDCHWSIEERWSYGNPPQYVLMHLGYIYKDIEIIYYTYDEALAGLNLHLNKAISSVVRTARDILASPEIYDEYDVEYAKQTVEIYNNGISK